MAENHLHHGKGIASTQRSSAWPSHASLSLSLSHCARVLATTVTPRAESLFHHSQQRLVACLLACLTPPTPNKESLHPGYLAVSGGVGGEGRGLALLLLLRERITQRGEEGERRGEGRAGEVEEEEGRRVWRLPSHTPPLALHQPAFLSLLFKSLAAFEKTEDPGMNTC